MVFKCILLMYYKNSGGHNYRKQVEKLIKELPSLFSDWSNGDVDFIEKSQLSNGISLQHGENGTNLRETQSMLLERIVPPLFNSSSVTQPELLKFYLTLSQSPIVRIPSLHQYLSLVWKLKLRCFDKVLKHGLSILNDSHKLSVLGSEVNSSDEINCQTSSAAPELNSSTTGNFKNWMVLSTAKFLLFPWLACDNCTCDFGSTVMTTNVDPNISKLFVAKGTINADSFDISIVAEKGQVACRDFPHSRHSCVKYPFKKTNPEHYCRLKVEWAERALSCYIQQRLEISEACYVEALEA